MAKKDNRSRGTFKDGIKTRLMVISALFFLFITALIARLVSLQIVQHEALLKKSEKQYVGTVETQFGRGMIYDRNMNELAQNVEVESVYVTPAEILNRRTTARILSAALNLDQSKVYKKISSKKDFVWIKRKCDLKGIDKLRQANLPGVGFLPEQKRFYPKRELAANVLGFVGIDNQGLAGIEHAHQSKLKGATIRRVTEHDARGRNIQPLEGLRDSSRKSYDIVLTLDEVIQFITEYHLKKQVERFKADSGMAVVMDPHTGEIYAMANVPQFNPNQFGAFSQQTWKNNIVARWIKANNVGIVCEPNLDKLVDCFFEMENLAFNINFDQKIIDELGYSRFCALLNDVIFHD